MNKLQKGLLAAAVTLAFTGSSAVYGAATINFDPTGNAGAGGFVAVDTFDWSPGNALAVGALSTPPVGGSVTFNLVAQGKLGNFISPGGGLTLAPAGREFTFQIQFFESATGIGTATSLFTAGSQPLTSSFTIFESAANSNTITGTGFGDGTPILHGTLVASNGNFTNLTLLAPAVFPVVLLDQLNADNQNGTLTDQGSGSTTVQINVDSQNNNFFLSNINSLTIDLQDTTNNTIPFLQTDPSDAVLGIIPNYSVVGGKRVNGDSAGCIANGGQTEAGVPTARCDIHLQTDASTSFNPIPEPGMLALLGLGLGALGLGRRKRARG